jgi:hypothetical protein
MHFAVVSTLCSEEPLDCLHSLCLRICSIVAAFNTESFQVVESFFLTP